MTTHRRTAGTLAAVALAGLAATGGQAASASSKSTAKSNRGGNCANPWEVSYAKGKVTGDTKEVSLKVTIKGRKISVTWHAQAGYTFCSITLVEAKGQIFESVNPSATYTYTDKTKNQSNGIKTLTATARNGSKATSKAVKPPAK